MFHLFFVAGSVTVRVFFANDNIIDNEFCDGWDYFLLATSSASIL